MKNAKWIRDRRTAAGLSQAELAQKVGVTQPIVSQWERGRAEPSPIALEKLRRVLGEPDKPRQSVIPELEAPNPSPSLEEPPAATRGRRGRRPKSSSSRDRSAAVFKLDNDFDFLVDSTNVHILRPSGFEFAGRLQQAILDAVPSNIAALRKDLAFVAFDGIEEYAGKHPRAARYLASIRGQEETTHIEMALLTKLCRQTGVEVSESKGKLTIAAGHEMGFLEVLDRRRYEVSLVNGKPERYRAASRRKIGV